MKFIPDTCRVYWIRYLRVNYNRYFCWWTVSPREYHPPSSQCCGTCMLY